MFKPSVISTASLLLSLLLLFSLLLSGSFRAAAAPQPLLHYRVISLGSRFLPTGPHCLSQSGIVAGEVRITGTDPQAYRWQNGRMTALNIAEDDLPDSSAFAVNSQGQIVGTLDRGSGEMNFHAFGHAFLWQHGKWQDINASSLGEVSHAIAINDKGEIAISTQESSMLSVDVPDPGAEQPSYLYRKGQMFFLGAKVALALNNKSQVLLRSWDHQYFIWDNGKTTQISAFDHADVTPGDMNDRGQIIGRDAHGLFLYQDGQFTILDPAPDSGVHSLNNKGQVIGYFDLPSFTHGDPIPSHACLWQNGKRTDLNTLISPKSGWVLIDAASINDRGQIVGRGAFHGKYETFLMTPILSRRRDAVLSQPRISIRGASSRRQSPCNSLTAGSKLRRASSRH